MNEHQFLSLGAGVQSTTMLLMAIHGEITPKPEAAIFADTGWEPEAVYRHLEWLEGVATKGGITIHRTSKGNLKEDLLHAVAGGETRVGRIGQPPFFVRNDAPEDPNDPDKGGMLRRKCTTEYKIGPIYKKIRELVGLRERERAKGVKVIQWKGISWDEIERVKPERTPWMEARYPLIELKMTRDDCLKWMESHGYPRPPKSSCLGCPYHSNRMWSDLRKNSPLEWADTVVVDRAIRTGIPGVKGNSYMHRSMRPLDEAILNQEDKGQGTLWDEFGDECGGVCGV